MKHEAGGSPDPTASANGVETACQKLKADLTDILGVGGVSAILRRALKLAQRDQPILAQVALDPEPSACFTGLEEALAATRDGEASAAGGAILAHLIGLLVLLLGDELGMQPVHRLWPHVASSAGEMNE